MIQKIPTNLINNINSPVLAYIEGQSAHSDIADGLISSVKICGDVQTFCPDPDHFRYVIVSTNGIIFGLAVGMSTIAFRLDARMKSRALKTGAVDYPSCGTDWVSFHPLFEDCDWPKVDVPFWALKAYVYARETREQGKTL